MHKVLHRFGILIFLGSLFLLAGCFGKVDKLTTNYYVLDYQRTNEDPSLMRSKNTGKNLEVLDTYLPRTYDRNQIVIKENLYSIRYLQTDVWASRLRDAIPGIVMQRLSAYNIFGQVYRSALSEKTPQYYLETNVLNIEKLDGSNPKAYLRMEFILRDSTYQNVVLTHKNERYTDLNDPSMVSLVQAFNEMIMLETNIFAAKCNLYFNGTPIQDSPPQFMSNRIEQYYYEKMASSNTENQLGELLVNTRTRTEEQLTYSIERLDSLNNVLSQDEWEMNKAQSVVPGRYRITLGELDDITIPIEIKPRQRCVISPAWGELQVVIIDESQTRVRSGYEIWIKDTEGIGYKQYGGTFSVGVDEIGSVDKLWLLPPGPYMVKLGGGSWNDLRNFATVTLAKGEKKTLTIVIDPNSDTNFFVGAGVFADEDMGYTSKRIHKGAVHGNISLASNNNVDKKKPSNSLTLSGQFDNSVDTQEFLLPFHFTSRSLYDLGMNLSTGNDFQFNLDDYSLRSVLMLYPWKTKPLLKNFAFYGRADQSTHFFDEQTNFSDDKNVILLDAEGNLVDTLNGIADLKTKTSFFPLRLKEGTGLTYRFYFNSNSWISLRSGYGMQQDYNHNSYILKSTNDAGYDIYQEDADRTNKGIECTAILSAANLLKFISINSTLDLLFPVNSEENYHLENENRINLKILRNVSLDIKLNIAYDRQVKPWVVYDSSSFLRLSLYY